MEIEIQDYSNKTEDITRKAYDCVWVFVGKGRRAVPTKSAGLQWLDWKMGGRLSKILAEPKDSNGPLFIPTRGRLNSAYLVVETGGATVDELSKGCAGMKFQNVLCYFESEADLKAIQGALKKRCGEEFPKQVTLGFDN